MNDKIINMDFASLYPTTFKEFNESTSETLLEFLRERKRQKVLNLRKEKLKKINEIYEENN